MRLPEVILSSLLLAAFNAAAPQSSDSAQTCPAQANSIFSCPAASWPPGMGIGTLMTPQEPDKELQDIMSQVDPKRVEDIITKLVSFGTRNTLSNQTDPKRGIGASRDWIAAQMREFAKASK